LSKACSKNNFKLISISSDKLREIQIKEFMLRNPNKSFTESFKKTNSATT